MVRFARILAVMIATATMLASRGASAEGIYPLGVGYQWVYRSVHGERNTQTIVGTTEIWGHEVYVMQCSESTYNDSLINYESNDPTGGGLVWGWYLGGGGVLYDPPMRVVSGSPFLGEEWGDTTVIHFLPDSSAPVTLIYTMRVFTDEVLSLPIGSLHAYGVGFSSVIFPKEPGGRSLLGKFGLDRDGAATTWYADQIGMVQEATSDLYQLVSYDFSPTPIENVSWGGLKFRWLPESVTGKTGVPGSQMSRGAPGPVEPIRLPQ